RRKLSFRESVNESLHSRANRLIERHATNRKSVCAQFCWNADAIEAAITIDEFGGRDFGEVVIFGRDPKHRHSLDAALRQAISKLHRRKSFVDRVKRPAKQTGLLSRDDRNAIRIAQ